MHYRIHVTVHIYNITENITLLGLKLWGANGLDKRQGTFGIIDLHPFAIKILGSRIVHRDISSFTIINLLQILHVPSI